MDVSQLAFYFGGGGHPAASGADIPGDLNSVQSLVVQKTLAYLDTVNQGKSENQVSKII